MSKSDLGLRRVSPAVQRYGLSILSVAICTAVTFPLQEFGVRVSLFFPAVLLATWFGGTGPGLLAVLLSILSINFFSPNRSSLLNLAFVIFLPRPPFSAGNCCGVPTATTKIACARASPSCGKHGMSSKAKLKNEPRTVANEELHREIINAKTRNRSSAHF